ncbi:GntR family transcriptional regulator [Nonomuraea insulae]|uniref:GntR family transcriptional regulator n=1 Tax=Nonomuraea insulae TaxID=1616787 RepID=A0ABW1DBN4_9ACTN
MGGVLGARHAPLRDQVRDEVRRRIVEGLAAPGERLIEQDLADEFGVSRIPVREALRMLETEGFVEAVPRRGVVVRGLTREDLQHLYDVREALEVLAFRLAAERSKPSDVAVLRDHLDRAGRAGEHEEISAANTAFHEAVVEMAGNPVLTSLLEPLTGRLRWLISNSHEHERQAQEHGALLDALADRDTERAAALALAHIRVSRAHALAAYDNRD